MAWRRLHGFYKDKEENSFNYAANDFRFQFFKFEIGDRRSRCVHFYWLTWYFSIFLVAPIPVSFICSDKFFHGFSWFDFSSTKILRALLKARWTETRVLEKFGNWSGPWCTIERHGRQEEWHARSDGGVVLGGGQQQVVAGERHDVERVVLALDGLEEGGKQVAVGLRFVHLDFVLRNVARRVVRLRRLYRGRARRQQVLPIGAAADHFGPLLSHLVA